VNQPCNLRDLADPERLTALAKDAALVALGFAVLGFQKAQVLRREIERSLANHTH
jgi:hypothetical protein